MYTKKSYSAGKKNEICKEMDESEIVTLSKRPET